MAKRRIWVSDIKEMLVHWVAGESVRQIARGLGYDRVTVRKYIHAAEQLGLQRGQAYDEAAWDELGQATLERVAGRRPPGTVAAEVARYHDYLAERIGQVRLHVLHQRLRDEQGLQASWGVFYRYIARTWPDRLERQPKATIRLPDPPPGEEAQVDFFYVGRWQEPNGSSHRLSALVLTLSHSRHCFVYPTLREDAVAWQEGHVAAFAFWGGAPRRLVPDNLTAGILKADLYDPRVNRAYGELTRYYGCLVDPARIRTPTDKPRVERNVDYARHGCFDGRTCSSLTEWRQVALRWCLEVAGQRIHGTTKERPLEAFVAREQPTLLPLPPKPWEALTWDTVLVSRDCHIRLTGGEEYTVPSRYVGRHLDVRYTRKTVEIYDGATLVVPYVRQPGGETRIEHYPEAAQAFLRATPKDCRQRAAAIGPATETAVGTLLEPGTLTHLRQAQAILRLEARFGAERLERACRGAVYAGDVRNRTVRGILEGGFDQLEPEAPPPPQWLRGFLRGPAAILASLEDSPARAGEAR